MRSDTDMKQPYGPGWEEPDWTPPPAGGAASPLPLETVRRPASLGQFMALVRRIALPRRAANARRVDRNGLDRQAVALAAEPGSPTRRWVMAGGASLLAVGSFALPRNKRKATRDRG